MSSALHGSRVVCAACMCVAVCSRKWRQISCVQPLRGQSCPAACTHLTLTQTLGSSPQPLLLGPHPCTTQRKTLNGRNSLHPAPNPCLRVKLASPNPGLPLPHPKLHRPARPLAGHFLQTPLTVRNAGILLCLHTTSAGHGQVCSTRAWPTNNATVLASLCKCCRMCIIQIVHL